MRRAATNFCRPEKEGQCVVDDYYPGQRLPPVATDDYYDTRPGAIYDDGDAVGILYFRA